MNNHEQTRIEKQSWLNHKKHDSIETISKTYFGHYFISGDILSDINSLFSVISWNVSTWNLFRSHSPQLIACIRYSNPVVSRDYLNQGSVDGSHFGTIRRVTADDLRKGWILREKCWCNFLYSFFWAKKFLKTQKFSLKNHFSEKGMNLRGTSWLRLWSFQCGHLNPGPHFSQKK